MTDLLTLCVTFLVFNIVKIFWIWYIYAHLIRVILFRWQRGPWPFCFDWLIYKPFSNREIFPQSIHLSMCTLSCMLPLILLYVYILFGASVLSLLVLVKNGLNSGCFDCLLRYYEFPCFCSVNQGQLECIVVLVSSSCFFIEYLIVVCNI